MRRSRMALALGLGLLVLGGLGGCSDDPVPKIAPSESPSASESPAADVQRTPVAIVRAWVAAQNRALRTGDLSRVRQLSANPCQACDDFMDPIEQVYEDGGRFETKGWSVDGAKARAVEKQPVVVDAAVTIAGGKTFRTAGAEPVVYKAEKHMIVFKVVQQADSWRVSFIGFLS